MSIVSGVKKLFEKKPTVVEFTIQTDKPKLEIGSIHEDNYWFHGTKFKILSITNIEESSDERLPYTVKGMCEVLED